MNGEDPLLSVVIATYNDARFLRESVASVLAQDLPGPVEILIVDDGSEPPAASIYQPADPRIRMLRQDNRGAGAARNLGIRHARGRYIAILDADDIMLPGRLRRQAGLLEARPEAGLAAGDITRRGLDGKEASWGIFESFSRPLPCEPIGPDAYLLGEEFRELVLLEYPFHSSFTVRRGILADDLRFDESLKCYEEWDFIARVARRSRVAYDRKPGTIHRKRPGSITTTPNPAKLVSRAAMFRRWRVEFADLSAATTRALRRNEAQTLLLAAYEHRAANPAAAARYALRALAIRPGWKPVRSLAATFSAFVLGKSGGAKPHG